MNDLDELRAQLADGWTVKITDHDYLNDSREGTLYNVTPEGFRVRFKRPVQSQGRTYPGSLFLWDLRDGDKHVREGNTVHFYVMGRSLTSRTTPGKLRLCKSYTFSAPK